MQTRYGGAGLIEEELSTAFNEFSDLMQERIFRSVHTTEDSIRYTLFHALTKSLSIGPSDVIMEYPHPTIEKKLVDTVIPPKDARLGLVFEFKYDREHPGGKSQPKTMKAGLVFKDLFRLARFDQENHRRFFVYMTDREMAVYFSNGSNRLEDFFNLEEGRELRIDDEYMAGRPATFVKAVGDLFIECTITCHLERLVGGSMWLRIYEIETSIDFKEYESDRGQRV